LLYFLALASVAAVLPEGPGTPFHGDQDVGPDSLPPDLRSVLDAGRILQDRNGDGIIDFVDTRILLPVLPQEAEVAVAANLGARLGFETSGSDLSLAETVTARARYEELVFLVGAGAMREAGVSGPEGPVPGGLAPGEGILVQLPAEGVFRVGAIGLVGYDATGLLEAGDYLSGRYPAVWAPEGVTWTEVLGKVEAFVAGRLGGQEVAGEAVEEAPLDALGKASGESPGGPRSTCTLDRIVVDAARPGVARARVEVRVDDEAAFETLVDAFLGRDTIASTRNPSGGAEPGGKEEPLPGAPAGSSVSRVQDPGKILSLVDLEIRDLHRLDVLIVGPGAERTVTLRPRKPWGTEGDAGYRRLGDESFSLAGVYGVGGLYRDTNRDLVPDETAAYLSLSGAGAGPSVIDLATRIGLESAGLRFPLVRVASQENDPTTAGFPLLVGTDHYQIQRLEAEGRLAGTGAEPGEAHLGPGEGFVELVDRAFGERSAMVVGGRDTEGLRTAVDWLARRAPFLWRYGKGEYRLADAETEVRRFLQARTAPGQVALALSKLEGWMDRMVSRPLEEGGGTPPVRVEVELAALEVPTGVEEVLSSAVEARFPEAHVAVSTWSTGFGVGDTVFVHDWEIPWEVEDARRILAEEVYPEVGPGGPVEVELRVSEAPEIRTALETEIRNGLAARGAPDARVHVLSAYKQGYSWINDILLPRLRGQDVGSIRLTYHSLEESEEVRWQTIAAETRWLQEVYPIDAVLARELGISDSVVTFHPTRRKDPIYTFEALDPSGGLILRETFTPTYVVRPFFDLFPEYEQVRVTTGWIRATSGGSTLVDRRIATDPERFWDRLQTEAYGEIVDYVMDSQDGNPSPGNAPFFDVFRVDLRLSEPDYRIGVDEEAISSLEALHEDIFFETHTLFNLIGGRYQTSLSYPGRVLPFVDPGGEGEAGRARLVLTGKARGNPELVVRTWSVEGGEPELRRYELDPLPVEAPRLVGATLASGEEGLKRLLTRVMVVDSLDRVPEYEGRSSEGSIDREIVSAELLEGMIHSLGSLHKAGLFEDRLAWDRIEELALDFRMQKDTTFRKLAILSRSGAPRSTDNPHLVADGWRSTGEPLVQLETPMGVEETEEVLARLGTFPGVDVYYLTDSYLGHRVWAADLLPPQEAAFLSQAKLNALKPTIFISGREHANEVSSTSHILRLGELLATDDAYRGLLKKVNVVLHPMTNPDGAALAWERQRVNPNHMLHAGRPGALGVDATAGGQSEDPVYPEARARHLIREAWLPDVYLNPHGYPSHEWVQYFAGYSAWVRSRRGGARDWWVPRSWFIPGFSWVDDEENPDYKEAQFALLDTMAAAMTSSEDLASANRRLYARYRKYGVQDREGFTEYFYNGMLVNMALKGAESIGNGLYSPRITYFSATTEAPDETAQGPWMDLMTRMGLTHTSSALRYLASGTFEVKREAKAFQGTVTRKVFRVKPVLPGGG